MSTQLEGPTTRQADKHVRAPSQNENCWPKFASPGCLGQTANMQTMKRTFLGLSRIHAVAIVCEGAAHRVGPASRRSPSSFPSLTKRWAPREIKISSARPLGDDVRDRRDACPTAWIRLSGAVAAAVLITQPLTARAQTNDPAQVSAAAKAGDLKAQRALALMYFTGQGLPQDLSAAVKWTRQAAEGGLAEAQNDLGQCYATGRSVTLDSAEAARWYRKAADQGFAPAQLQLARCYEQATGVPLDLKQSVKWYRKAAEQGNLAAQIALGRAYYLGHGIKQNAREAVTWLRKAAEQGEPVAQYYVGRCYELGDALPQDTSLAATWYRKAADQGQVAAQNALGMCYVRGEGVPQSYPEALKWLRQAAERGYSAGQYQLGLCCLKALGMKQDRVEAYIWLNLAAAQGEGSAAKLRDELADQLTREQVDEAQARARAFVPGQPWPAPPTAAASTNAPAP